MAKHHVTSHNDRHSGSISHPHGNPDKGPQMHEGAHHFDKGYTSDHEYFSPGHEFPDNHQRGNMYMEHQNEIVKKDSKKLSGQKFNKIA